MSIRCMTVPPRMNPRGFASFGNTTWTISVADSDERFGVIRSGGQAARGGSGGSNAHRTRMSSSKPNVSSDSDRQRIRPTRPASPTQFTGLTALALLPMSAVRFATVASTVVLAALAMAGDPIAQSVTVASGADLQEALNRARPGDTILLTRGTSYVGNFKLPAKDQSDRVITV